MPGFRVACVLLAALAVLAVETSWELTIRNADSSDRPLKRPPTPIEDRPRREPFETLDDYRIDIGGATTQSLLKIATSGAERESIESGLEYVRIPFRPRVPRHHFHGIGFLHWIVKQQTENRFLDSQIVGYTCGFDYDNHFQVAAVASVTDRSRSYVVFARDSMGSVTLKVFELALEPTKAETIGQLLKKSSKEWPKPNKKIGQTEDRIPQHAGFIEKMTVEADESDLGCLLKVDMICRSNMFSATNVTRCNWTYSVERNEWSTVETQEVLPTE